MRLRTQLLLLQSAVVLLVVCSVGVAAALMQAAQIRDSYQQQMIAVAQSVAMLPTVRDAYDDPDPAAKIQPIAELIREASGVTYVVLTDREGIRYSHPDPGRLGEKVSTDPSVPLAGEMYTGTQRGTLGLSWRVKVPVRDREGNVIGAASVGILESELRADLEDRIPTILGWSALAALLGGLGAALVSRLVWRRIHRLEPEEIAALLETREAMLHGIGEALVAVDAQGRIALVNDEAGRLLGLTDDAVGSRATSALDPAIVALLADRPDQPRMVLSGERVLVARRNEAVVDGRVVGSVLILRDRTELHDVLHELDGARDVSEALRAQAHEFANTMHVVSGLIETGSPDAALRFITDAGYGGALGAAHLAPEVADPAVSALLMAKAAGCRERGISLVVEPGSQVAAEVASDVVTVLGNLIDNAVEAVGAGGRVHVAIRTTPGMTTVVVEDDGPGIAEEHRDSVLEPGWSTRGNHGGRGIGLALVSRIAVRREGSVEIGTSGLGGARFSVELRHAHAAEVAR